MRMPVLDVRPSSNLDMLLTLLAEDLIFADGFCKRVETEKVFC